METNSTVDLPQGCPIAGHYPIDSDFDYTDPALGANFYSALRTLREQSPLHRSDAKEGYWVVTRYRDVIEILQDWERFSSERGLIIPPMDGVPRLIPVEVDPPDHQLYRKLVNRFLTPAYIERYEEDSWRIVNELIDNFHATGRCDFMTDLASVFPGRMFLELVLGASSDDIKTIQESIVVATVDSGTQEGTLAMLSVFQWVAEFIAQRKAGERRDDIVDSVLYGKVGDRPIADDEIMRFLFLLIAGGLDTTSFLAGNAALRMATDPAMRQTLRDDLTLLPGAIDEFLRLDGSFAAVCRVATVDCQIGGQDIREGDRILLYLAAGSRDGDEFPSAESFDLERRSNRHLGFGAGRHRCVGSHLARQNLRILFTSVLTRMPDLRLAEPDVPIQWVQSLLHGPRSLPVVFDPSAAVEPVTAS